MSKLVPAFRLLGLGWLVVVAILGGFLLGLQVDRLLGLTFPAFGLLGLFLGIVAAFVGILRLVASVSPPDQRPRKGGG